MTINISSILLFPLLASVVGLLHIVPPAVDASYIDTKKLGLFFNYHNTENQLWFIAFLTSFLIFREGREGTHCGNH
jgi:hypothetical protein